VDVMNDIDDFADAIFNAGLGCPNVITDGRIHRFNIEGQRHKKFNGWYVLSQNGDGYHGSFGDWSTDFKQNFSSKRSKPLSQRERDTLRLKIESDKQQRIIETRQKHEAAAISAAHIWDNSIPVIFHDYLKNKRVLPHGIRQHGEKLIIPMQDVNNKIWSLQTITPAGIKRFHYGGKTTGNFYQVGELTDPFYIAEGFSTASSVHQYFNKCCFIAFTCNNLLPAGKALKTKYPDHRIIIAADNDTNSPTNAGLTHGIAAAKAIEGELIFPNFETENGSDFNDLLSGDNYVDNS